jgi:DNA-binding transcriptional regulator PaaX
MKKIVKKVAELAPRYQRGSRYYDILEEITMGDLFVGFLSSARSTRLMYAVARKRAYERNKNKMALERLEACGYVRHREKDGKIIFFATKEGKRALHNAYQQSSSLTKHPRHWDGAWRIAAYDFPEEVRSYRNSLRYVLSKSGFLQIQKSVWLFPYDVPLLSKLLAKDTIVAEHTIFIKADSVSNETKYKKHFQLK